MTFLREQEVKEPLRYLIVETPEGNLGKDLISIFDERDSKTLELGIRKPLRTLNKSDTHCSSCGYFVIPGGVSPIKAAWHFQFLSLEDMQKKGQGLFCQRCESIMCAFCATLEGTKAPCPFCGEPMAPYTKEA
jgi:hypothetical protein